MNLSVLVQSYGNYRHHKTISANSARICYFLSSIYFISSPFARKPFSLAVSCSQQKGLHVNDEVYPYNKTCSISYVRYLNFFYRVICTLHTCTRISIVSDFAPTVSLIVMMQIIIIYHMIFIMLMHLYICLLFQAFVFNMFIDQIVFDCIVYVTD